MKTLLDFKLRESLSKINNFKTGGITTVSTMPGTIKMFKNMGIFDFMRAMLLFEEAALHIVQI